MRILFYLPVVTSWWFEQVIEPMIRRLATVAEVHVLSATPWRGTGLGPAELARCADLDLVHWAIADGEDHPSLRTDPADAAGLIDYVRATAPDLVLCRSADFVTPRRFPGRVRYIMEAVTAPFDPVSRANTVHFTDTPFVNGAMPPLAQDEAERLDALFAPHWHDMQAYWQARIPPREDLFRAIGLAEDLPLLLLPLDYEHEENFFLHHRPEGLDTRTLVQRAAAAAQGCQLVVTDHPLNTLHVDRSWLLDMADALPNVLLCDGDLHGVPLTTALAREASGMLLGESKSFAVAAAFGTPMVRQSRFASAPWLHAATDLPAFVANLRDGLAATPEETAVRRWFAYHFADEAFYPTDPELTGAMLLERALRPVDPARWEAGLGRLRMRSATLEDAA